MSEYQLSFPWDEKHYIPSKAATIIAYAMRHGIPIIDIPLVDTDFLDLHGFINQGKEALRRAWGQEDNTPLWFWGV